MLVLWSIFGKKVNNLVEKENINEEETDNFTLLYADGAWL